MANSDNAYGVHNKNTKILTQPASETDVTHADTNAAKAFFLSAAALTAINECATQEAYELTADKKGLKMTLAFGTKASGTAAADDWAETYKTRKQALEAATVGPTNITAITNATGAEDNDDLTVTAAGHGFAAGDVIQFKSVGGMTEINNEYIEIASVAGDNFVTKPWKDKNPTAYTSGGNATKICSGWARRPLEEANSEDHLF